MVDCYDKLDKLRGRSVRTSTGLSGKKLEINREEYNKDGTYQQAGRAQGGLKIEKVGKSLNLKWILLILTKIRLSV